MAEPRPPLDKGAVAALTWAAVAIGVTVVIGPQLGLRGWAWLGLHNLLCVVGVSHELWKARKRAADRAQRLSLRGSPGRP